MGASAMDLSTKSGGGQVARCLSSSFLIQNLLSDEAACGGREQTSGVKLQQCLPSSPPPQLPEVEEAEVVDLSVKRRSAEREEDRVGSGGVFKEEEEEDRRRNRTMFSEWQLASLEWRFSRNKYLTTGDRLRVAKMLELNQLQVKTWFQNRRMKWKKQILATGGQKSPTKPKGRPRRGSIPPIDDP